METLYNILEAQKEIESFEEMGEEEKKEYLNSIQEQKENKIDATFRVIKEYEAKEKAIEEEIKRLEELKEYYKNGTERIKKYVLYAMEQWNITRIEGKIGRCYTRNAESIIWGIVDKKFMKEKITYSIDKLAVKKAIKKGESIDGIEIIKKKSLIIK